MHLVDTGLGPSFRFNEALDLFSHGFNVPRMGGQIIQSLRQYLYNTIHVRRFDQILFDSP